MNAAELRTLRLGCGLSVNDFRKIAISPKTGEPVEERTVRYWETGRFSVPEQVADAISTIDEKLTDLATELAHEMWAGEKGYGEFTAFKQAENFWKKFPNLKGMPLGCHYAMLNRARLLLENDRNNSLDVYVKYFEE